ncbi:hypothetical protein C922_05187 [Plasmodium inui San Antonio 1]|uniref:Uncharacterized protein n=1 Tax=Plasmodium inui San Antonio 1 TaxID=1237626 RepID=W6ZYL5_9APIC|nr:hypothetical protein C922_05187 [Plasmodium inui San Antonio 1]EUD64443.1 hypothetical protein C922_05187 [Plasmodium inui San Antonio 1]
MNQNPQRLSQQNKGTNTTQNSTRELKVSQRIEGVHFTLRTTRSPLFQKRRRLGSPTPNR